ncbi:MAG TPA: AzlC family ABC transporter permease [Propionibacteriaceae bacterium]|nr:AzlC family ABC transporter permease [Propionibacteriaceae bacterium]
MPLALPIAAVGMSFGLLAGPVLGAIPSILMSAVVWSGTAQFAALSILTSGGGTALAASAGLLANTRFLPMGFAIAPSMTGGPLRRLLRGALLADASFVIGHRGGGRFDISAVAWAAPVQYVTWVGGTVVGVAGATAIGDPARWGLDVLFPVFYLSLLLPDLFPEHIRAGGRRGRRHADQTSGDRDSGSSLNLRPIIVAVLAAAITLVLTPIVPPGVPVLVAAAAALIGLRTPPQTHGGAGVDA